VLTVVVRLHNDGDEARRVAALEVQFADAAGRLVDVGREHLWTITVPPHGETACRLSVVPDQPMDWYATHRVLVRAAGAPNSFF
jgi:hypothetical protein